MNRWPKTKLGRFAYDTLTVFVATAGLYFFVGGIVALFGLLVGVQYVVFRALFGKPPGEARTGGEVHGLTRGDDEPEVNSRKP